MNKNITQNNGLFQVNNDKWGYRIKCTINGQKVDVRKTKDLDGNKMTTRQQAKNAQARHLLLLTESDLSSKKKNLNHTLSDIWDLYVASDPVGVTKKAPSTFRKQESLWRVHINPAMGHRPINSITSVELSNFLADLYADGYSYSYVESFCKFFWLIFGFAEKINALEPGVYSKMFVLKGTKVRMPAEDEDDILSNSEIEIYSDEEITLLTDYFENRNLKIAFLLGLHCGLRISEIFGLTWDCFNENAQTITINKQIAWDDRKHSWYLTRPKSRCSYRTIPLPNDLCTLIKEEKSRQNALKRDQPYLWKSNTSTIILDYRKNYSKVVHTAEEFINLKYNGELLTNNSTKYDAQNIKNLFGFKLHFHTLRRTFITKMAKSGVDKAILMKMTGHSKYETISKYYEGIERKNRLELIDALNTFISKKCA